MLLSQGTCSKQCFQAILVCAFLGHASAQPAGIYSPSSSFIMHMNVNGGQRLHDAQWAAAVQVALCSALLTALLPGGAFRRQSRPHGQEQLTPACSRGQQGQQEA